MGKNMKIKYFRDSQGKFSSITSKLNAFAYSFFKRLVVGYTVFALMFIGAVAADGQVKVKVVNAEVQAKEVVRTVPPILQRIAKCESKTGQYKDGQVVINQTLDLGAYQINLPAHAKQATKMHLDLSKPEDNETFAIWLFNNEGTTPWNSSRGCWGK